MALGGRVIFCWVLLGLFLAPGARGQEPLKLVSATKLAGKPVRAWSEDDVEHWLTEVVGLPEHAKDFAEHEIDGTVLALGLSHKELEQDLQIRKIGNRKRIITAIARLNSYERRSTKPTALCLNGMTPPLNGAGR